MSFCLKGWSDRFGCRQHGGIHVQYRMPFVGLERNVPDGTGCTVDRCDDLKSSRFCLTPFGSRKDRHAKIGEGKIGLDALVRLVNHLSLRHLPFCLETPNELPGYADGIAMLKARFQSS